MSEIPKNAFEGLSQRLVYLNAFVSSRDEEKKKILRVVRWARAMRAGLTLWRRIATMPQRLLAKPPSHSAWRSAFERHLIERRNTRLRAYRKRALGFRPRKDSEPKPSLWKHATRVFSYLHGEFDFNAPRPVCRTTRITHLVFAPVFVEKTQARSDETWLQRRLRRGRPRRPEDPAQVTRPVTDAAFEWLWRRALQNHRAPQAEVDPTFRGAHDVYFLESKELFDYSEPFITPKRSILARRQMLMDRLLAARNAEALGIAALPEAKPSHWGLRHQRNQAIEENKKIEAELNVSGLSHRHANIVEYFWKHYSAPSGDLEIAHFRWVRHDRPYQTFTFTHEIPGLQNIKTDGSGADPFQRTALHAFPGDMFADGAAQQDGKARKFAGVFGRFIEGTNWLFLPLENFLREPANDDGESLIDCLDSLATGKSELKKDLAALRRSGAKHPGKRPSAREVRAVFDRINLDNVMAAAADRFVIKAMTGFLEHCFHYDGDDREIVGIKCMDGRGYIFAHLRHHAGGNGDRLHSVLTRAVIVDCGMHKFQRGRLVQSLTEFCTERTMALRWIARFRLLHSALGVIEAKLNLAVSNYHNNISQFACTRDGGTDEASFVPYEYWSRLHIAESSEDGAALDLQSSSRERQLIIALEFLSSCLSLMHDVVEGGMMDRASGTLGSVVSLREKLRAIRETHIIGHQSLTDFLERRFIPATRVISRAGDRYQSLRNRITAIADLMNTTLSAKEWHQNQNQVKQQTRLLRVAELVGALAAGYYGSNLFIEFLREICGITPLDMLSMCVPGSYLDHWYSRVIFAFFIFCVVAAFVKFIAEGTMNKTSKLFDRYRLRERRPIDKNGLLAD